jgi:hypothetical protein
MLSEGTPTSTVLIPVLEAIIGPIVDPQGQSLRTTNSWQPTSALLDSSLTMNPVAAVVAYL